MLNNKSFLLNISPAFNLILIKIRSNLTPYLNFYSFDPYFFMKFLDMKTDFAFKKVFGSEDSKDLLIDFLNSVIIFENEQKIQSLIIVDPYNIPMLKGMKDTYVDVKAELDNKSHVIIEMQVLNHEGFEKRILYNAAKKYSA